MNLTKITKKIVIVLGILLIILPRFSFAVTRLYLPSDALATPISPTPDTAWEESTGLTRTTTPTTKRSSAMTDKSNQDDTTQTVDWVFKQFVSDELTSGQTITGSQALKWQIRARENAAQANAFTSLGIRIIASDGTTVRKTVLAVTLDDTETVTILTNRQFTATSAATNYTTVAGDYLVIETGMRATFLADSTRTIVLRFGDAAASDLPEDDTDTTDLNPWVQLTDTLTFATAATSDSGEGIMFQQW